jgi:hypothetical protein
MFVLTMSGIKNILPAWRNAEMPDGDRFERALYGKGWRKAYRLACANQSFDLIGDAIITAVAAALRGPLACNSLIKIRDAVFQALREKARTGLLNFSDRPLSDPFRMLSDLLDDIAAEDSNSAAARLAGKKAREVYLGLQQECRSVTLEQVEESLAEAFGWGVVRHQCLAKAREGIMRKADRTFDEQMEWEDGLSAHLAERLKKTVNQMFRADGKVAVRAPRRTTPQRKMTIEELHQGIAVLEV